MLIDKMGEQSATQEMEPVSNSTSPVAQTDITESKTINTTESSLQSGIIARPTTMPSQISSRVPPPLGPFPNAFTNMGELPSPLDLPLYTPYGNLFSAAPMHGVIFDYSGLRHNGPMSPMTPMSPGNYFDERNRHLSRSSSINSRQGRMRHPSGLDQQTLLMAHEQMYQQSIMQPQQQSSPSIKHTWYRTFDELFSQFREPWMLKQIDEDCDEPNDPGWVTEEYWAKVRFICETQSCPNQWTSMRGVIRFWYTTALRPYYGADGACVLIRELRFRSFGQKCAKCGNPQFQKPLWYEREVKKVLGKIFEHIGRKVYNWYLGVAMRPRVYVESQRGAPTAEHKSELCQGCANNTCTLSATFRKRTASFGRNREVNSKSPSVVQREMHSIPEDEIANSAEPIFMGELVNGIDNVKINDSDSGLGVE